MLTDRQRSFIATVEAVDGTFNFLDQLLGKPAEIVTPSLYVPPQTVRPPWINGRLMPPTTIPAKVIPSRKQDDSNYLGHVPDTVDIAPCHLYFRCFDNGYRLFVRSSVRYKRALISMTKIACAR